jgi:hypothetical protein
MALARVEPANVDVAIADAISGHTRPGPERAAKALKWGADEHILCAFGWWWLCCRGKDADYRRASDHVLLTTRLCPPPCRICSRLFSTRSGPAKQRDVIRSLGAGLVLTGIVLLAHWASDVAVGLAVGVLTERLLRKLTDYGA